MDKNDESERQKFRDALKIVKEKYKGRRNVALIHLIAFSLFMLIMSLIKDIDKSSVPLAMLMFIFIFGMVWMVLDNFDKAYQYKREIDVYIGRLIEDEVDV